MQVVKTMTTMMMISLTRTSYRTALIATLLRNSFVLHFICNTKELPILYVTLGESGVVIWLIFLTCLWLIGCW